MSKRGCGHRLVTSKRGYGRSSPDGRSAANVDSSGEDKAAAAALAASKGAGEGVRGERGDNVESFTPFAPLCVTQPRVAA